MPAARTAKSPAEGESFGDFVSRERRQQGLSVRELARRCGLSASQVSRIERGVRGSGDRLTPAGVAITEALAIGDVNAGPAS